MLSSEHSPPPIAGVAAPWCRSVLFLLCQDRSWEQSSGELHSLLPSGCPLLCADQSQRAGTVTQAQGRQISSLPREF